MAAQERASARLYGAADQGSEERHEGNAQERVREIGELPMMRACQSIHFILYLVGFVSPSVVGVIGGSKSRIMSLDGKPKTSLTYLTSCSAAALQLYVARNCHVPCLSMKTP